MNAQRQMTQQQTQDELDLQFQISHLTTFSMELGRRHGLGSKAMEFNHLPLQQRKDRLEALLDFIHGKPTPNGSNRVRIPTCTATSAGNSTGGIRNHPHSPQQPVDRYRHGDHRTEPR